MKMRISRAVAAALLGVATAFSPAALSADRVKVGFIYVGPVGDHGWTYQHDQARLALEKEFGDQVETTFVESVNEGPDAERVARELAASGHELIFATSFGFMEQTLKVARLFPDVKFEHATGYKRADNMATYNVRFYEGRYIAGVIAGKETKSGIIGYVASHPIPEVIRGINSFTRGLRSVNPSAVVKVVWVNSWYDPGKEGAAAKTLMDQGADVMAQHTDSPAPLKEAETRGARGFGQASDMRAFAPGAQMSAAVNNWSPYYIRRVREFLEDRWESGDVWGGLSDNMIRMAAYENMAPETAALARETEEKIRSGALHPFQGPVRDQKGDVRVPAGETPDDQFLLTMSGWYVEGVEGEPPQ